MADITTVLYTNNLNEFKQLLSEQRKLGFHRNAKIKLYRYKQSESIKWCLTCKCKRIPENGICPICGKDKLIECVPQDRWCPVCECESIPKGHLCPICGYQMTGLKK